MRAAHQRAWPAVIHLGGPLPILSAQTQLHLGIELADRAREFATDAAAFDALLSLARRVKGGERIPRQQLDGATKRSKQDAPAIRFAKLVARASLNYLYAAPSARNSVGASVEAAAATLVPLVFERHQDGVAGYLADLDARIVRVELEQLLGERAITPASPIARVGARPALVKDKLGCVIARLEDGRFGLYVKLRSRWEWHEGDRATVFATVPDVYMVRVTSAFEER